MLLLFAQLTLLLLLPLLVCVVALRLGWRHIPRRWSFFALAVILGYTLYGAVMYLLDPRRSQGDGAMIAMESDASAPSGRMAVVRDLDGDVMHFFLQPYVLRMAIFIAIFSVVLYALGKVFRRPQSGV